jgi:hypothetical protein
MDVRDYLYKEILPQYAHLRSCEEAMPVIRKLLGVPPGGTMPDNLIGRTMQRFIEANRKEALRKGELDSNTAIE